MQHFLKHVLVEVTDPHAPHTEKKKGGKDEKMHNWVPRIDRWIFQNGFDVLLPLFVSFPLRAEKINVFKQQQNFHSCFCWMVLNDNFFRSDILKAEMKVFFVKYNDPIYVKLEKLDIMIRLTNQGNIAQVLAELKEWVRRFV